MRRVVARDASDAQRLHELLAVVRELVNRMLPVVHHPHMLFRIVRIDEHRMRPPEDIVPLRPLFHDVARRIDDEQAVLPARIDAELALPSVPAVAARVTRAAHRPDGGVAKWRLGNRKGDARTDARIWHLCRPLESGSSPRISTKTRFGLSAKTPRTAPHVHFS